MLRSVRQKLYYGQFRKKVLTILSIVTLTACDTFWVRTSTIEINSSEFPECAFNAISSIEGLTIEDYWKSKGRVVGGSSKGSFEILLNSFGNVEVELRGRGLNPSNDSKQDINDTLAFLTKEVGYACN